MVASEREFFDAVLVYLQDNASVLVGDAVTPAGVEYTAETDLPTLPYVVVYPRPSGGTRGPLAGVHDDEDLVVQVSAFGRDRRSCQFAVDECKQLLLSADFAVPDREFMSRPRLDVGGGLMRDDDTAGPPLFYAHHIYRFPTTPA